MKKKKLFMNGVCSQATWDKKHDDPRTSPWMPTQTWSWKGGDAIVVVAGTYFKTPTTSYVVLRLGNDVRVYQADGLMDALTQAGQHTKAFEVA